MKIVYKYQIKHYICPQINKKTMKKHNIMGAIFFILLGITGCKKEIDPDPVNIIQPQEVVYKVKSKTDSRKRIVCELWAVDLKTHEKGVKVGQIDTIIIERYITITLIQNVKPVMYAYASLTVEVLDNKYDTFYIEIGNHSGPHAYSAGSCQTDVYDLKDVFLSLVTQ